MTYQLLDLPYRAHRLTLVDASLQKNSPSGRRAASRITLASTPAAHDCLPRGGQGIESTTANGDGYRLCAHPEMGVSEQVPRRW